METLTTVSQVIEHLKANPETPIADVVTTLERVSARPVRTGERRGQLAGVALADMTLEQLKREKINADSVLYKATQRNAAPETIAKNQARADAVRARLEVVAPKTTVAVVPEEITDAPAADPAIEGEL